MLSQFYTTILLKIKNLPNYRPINQLSQLSQKLKVGRKKFIGKSCSARKNTSSGLYPATLRLSRNDLEFLPNYTCPINQLSQLSQKLKVGGKKFIGKSCSARKNTSSGFYPAILRHSGNDLEFLPNYAQLRV